MSPRKKSVITLHDRLKIIHEVDKNPGEKHVDIAKRLGLPASTLISIFTKKNEDPLTNTEMCRLNVYLLRTLYVAAINIGTGSMMDGLGFALHIIFDFLIYETFCSVAWYSETFVISSCIGNIGMVVIWCRD
jgi:hypothetical protein